MMRQYGAQRRRGGANPLGVGVIAVGAIYYLQDPGWFSDRTPGPLVCKVPWQVEGFTNGLLHAARRDPETRQWRDSYWSGRSDLAVVRSLRDGRRRTVAVRLLILHSDPVRFGDHSRKRPFVRAQHARVTHGGHPSRYNCSRPADLGRARAEPRRARSADVLTVEGYARRARILPDGSEAAITTPSVLAAPLMSDCMARQAAAWSLRCSAA